MPKKKDQHVNVFVRVKPVNNTDTPKKSVVEVASAQELLIYERSHDKILKRFKFDKVFGPSSSQVDVYETVVGPLLKEVLTGYNCTVFAYGQTGTGKTYTMEGSRVDDPTLHWQSNTSVGMIPRCLSQLFDELQSLENYRYTVRVHYLELYNEEVFDLLTNEEDPVRVKLYENVSKKGSVIIRGLKEITVQNKAEVYKILEKASERKQMAVSLMNANSSRSHTVFSITVHMEKSTDEGEELLKTAKLNLVDLAGSENVSKYGLFDRRAKEAKSINQSLLTLGRVITALLEKAPHVPYRESKLTRLLQESLGGRTKTSIIATISSCSSNLEETLSTLDYAHRAKNITNFPQINQRLHRKTLLKEYTEEIGRLRKDLLATREKKGIYLLRQDYDDMQMLITSQKKILKRNTNHLKLLEEIQDEKKKTYDERQSQYNDQMNELLKKKNELNDLIFSQQLTEAYLKHVANDRNQLKQLVEKYVTTEKILRGQGETLLSVIEEASKNVRKLHDELDYKAQLEKENEKLVLQMKDDFTKHIQNIKNDLLSHIKEIDLFSTPLKNEIETHIIAQAKNTKISSSFPPIMKNLVHQHSVAVEESKNNINTSYTHCKKSLNKSIQAETTRIDYENDLLNNISSKLASNIQSLLKFNKSTTQNLQTLRNNISQKLEDASTYAKDMVDTICKHRLEECDYIRKNLNEISEHTKCIFQHENQTTQNYKTFAKKMEDLYILHEFSFLNNSERIYSETVNKTHQIDEVCNNICSRALQSYNEDVDKQQDLKQFIQTNISQVKNDIQDNINQAQTLNKIATEEKNILIKDLHKNLNIGCTTLKQHNDNVQFNMEQSQKKLNEYKNTMLTSIANISNVVKDIDFTYISCMEQQKNEISDFHTGLDNKLEAYNIESRNWNAKIAEELGVLKHRIDKFFTEDLFRDITTGTTPVKKEFSYPRQLAVTSPEPISRMFEEDTDCTDETKNLDLTSSKYTLANELYITSTPYNNLNIAVDMNTSSFDAYKKCMSVDLSRISTISEPEVYAKNETVNDQYEDII